MTANVSALRLALCAALFVLSSTNCFGYGLENVAPTSSGARTSATSSNWNADELKYVNTVVREWTRVLHSAADVCKASIIRNTILKLEAVVTIAADGSALVDMRSADGEGIACLMHEVQKAKYPTPSQAEFSLTIDLAVTGVKDEVCGKYSKTGSDRCVTCSTAAKSKQIGCTIFYRTFDAETK